MFNGLKPRKWTFWIKTIAGKVQILFFKKAEKANRLFVPMFSVVYGLQFSDLIKVLLSSILICNLVTWQHQSQTVGLDRDA